MSGLTADQTQRLISYDTSRKLKSLNTTRSKLLSQAKKCRIQIKQAENDLLDIKKRIGEIDVELDSIERDNPTVVSEHALLRYMERYKNINLDDIANEVANLPEEKLVRKGNSIVTILEDNQ